ncbi:DUF445 domain-containing protein [Bacillus sp. EB106-08-02-XG196]|jgi:uncharacterized membrane-anchored protein YjiN (DUF445 family)|uniref:DUF445 domain-containing protein n=1 Tax=Bacillus sp. EB106-08-02-XG196 TaxID=2737049 RepID=UPI0015C4D273|nr:DUF445 domain-containing protein [Bacillus sp. EB106-08-02-XG196]NWQ41130.1 DUF445 domain-containing protein [Bacillus sp. EB106-08-02-XG196]
MSRKKNKSKHLATISLAVMGLGFVVTFPFQDSLWGIILQGGFEAGLVGGLADWFAVTALFRHPLGIPIPHTALLPKNRKRIIAAIISMLENDWLTKESIRKKISSISFTEKLFHLAQNSLSGQPVRNAVVNLIQHLLHSIESKKLAPIIAEELELKLKDLNVSNYLPSAIDQLLNRKYDEKALDFILKEVDDWAKRESTKERLGRMAVDALENIKADGFMQFALKSFTNIVNEEKLGNIIQGLIQKGVKSFSDPFNPNRQTLLFHINTKLQDIKSDENLALELNTIKEQMISEWELEDKITEFVEQLKQKASSLIKAPNFYEGYLLPLLSKALENLKADNDKFEAIESWIQDQISIFVDNNHAKIGKLVEENLEKLDNETLIDMIENNVGKDLQWIRVNGAVCGFLIGLILVGLKLIF